MESGVLENWRMADWHIFKGASTWSLAFSRMADWHTCKLVRATKTDNFQMCAILLALVELACHSRERQTPCRGALIIIN